jgi:CheY-like chemotaxis protein
MPELDGLSATRAIREAERETGTHVAIAAMTANAFSDDRDACMAAGMDDYLAKPVKLADLRAMVERWRT